MRATLFGDGKTGPGFRYPLLEARLMTGLFLRKVRSGGMMKLKLIPAVVPRVIGGGVVKLERVQVICPACGQQVEAVAGDGRDKGYCAVAKQYVDFPIETQLDRKNYWQDPEYRARQSAAVKQRLYLV